MSARHVGLHDKGRGKRSMCIEFTRANGSSHSSSQLGCIHAPCRHHLTYGYIFQEGYFIIRPSARGEKKGKPYSLTLYHQQTNWNFHVRLRDDMKYAVGLYKESEACFETLAELVDHYKHTPIVLGEQEREVLLVGSPQELYSAC